MFSDLTKGQQVVGLFAFIGCIAAVVMLFRETIIFLNPNSFVLDSQIYWTMGRGILNGFIPYKDIFDLKPPGVFLLSAASAQIFGNQYLGNMLGALTLLSFPVTFVFFAWRIFSAPKAKKLLLVFIAILAGCFWSIFSAEKGQPWQTEVFGSFFALGYVATLFWPKKQSSSWVCTLIAALGLLGSLGMKEPFLFSCAGAAIVTANKPKDILSSFLIPLGIALVTGMSISLVLGYLQPYMHYYLPTLQYRGYGWDPLLLRGLYILPVGRNLADISVLAPWTLLLLIINLCIHKYTQVTGTALVHKILSALSVPFALYLGMIAVSSPGDFQSHHFVFLTPVFLTFVLLFLQKEAATSGYRWAVGFALLWSLTLMLSFKTPGFTPFSKEEITRMQSVAAGIDDVLTRCDVDRYFIIIQKDNLMPMGFTHHSPLNHSVFLPIDMAHQYGQEFLDISLQRLSDAQIILFPRENFQALNIVGNAMGAYIAKVFSEKVPPCADPLPTLQGYGILFRSTDEPFTETFEFDGPDL